MFRINTIAITVVLVSLTGWLGAQTLGDAEDLYEAGLYEESIALVDEIGSDEALSWFIKANCLHKMLQFEDALVCYKSARKKGCRDDKLRLYKGICNFSAGYLDDAEHDIWAYLGDHREDPKALYYMGAIAYMKMETRRSESYLELALEYDPEYMDALYLMGANLMERGKFSQASGYFERTSSYEPRSELNIAIALIEGMDYDAALSVLQKLDKKPTKFSAEIKYYLGEVHFALKQMDEACSAWTRASEMGDDDATRNLKNICVQGKQRVRKKRRSYSEF